ncbi:MAG: hypothetical protein Salg2KO_01020 [Salibacteraceae bacterium]
MPIKENFMMKWITISFMIFTFLCEGYSKETNIEYADSLRNEGLVSEAKLEYERIVFNAEDNTTRTLALIKKAQCHIDGREFGPAQSAASRITYFGLSDSLVYEARYTSSLSAYLNSDYTEAASQLLVVNQFLPAEYAIKSKPLYALALNELRRWDEAKDELSDWINWHYAADSIQRDSLLSEVEAIYNHKNYPKYRDPKRADLWATVLPGSGQLYSGYVFDAAFTALMVASGIGIALVGVFVVQYYVTGLIAGYGIYQRFYTAGIKRSEFLAKKRNYERNSVYNGCLQSFIIAMQSTD